MSAAELLAGFSRRGIQLRAEGERLSYDALQGVMKAADLEQLRKHKSELLAYLNREAANTIADPDGSCPDCGNAQYWQLSGQFWHCRACEPDVPLTATTLTLPCHKERVTPVGSHNGLARMIKTACEGLNIMPQQLHQGLDAGGDIPDLVSGTFTPEALWLTAMTLALMRYLPESERLPDLNRELIGD